MKKILISGVFALTAHASIAQWTSSSSCQYESTGHIGIGLSACPSYNLVVAEPAPHVGTNAIIGGATWVGSFVSGSPSSALQIQSESLAGMSLVSHLSGFSYDFMSLGTNNVVHNLYISNSNSTTKPFIIIMDDGTGVSKFAMTVWPNGQVGINTGTTTLGTTTQFAVEGMIACRELKVLPTSTAWPDYVFNKDFKRQSLEEVSDYIRQNKHLPQFPPAAEIEKNGFQIGETQAQVVQALEELYLHVIELKKENDQLKREIQSLKK